MTMSEGMIAKWSARLQMEGHDAKSIREAFDLVKEKGSTVDAPLAYVRRMLNGQRPVTQSTAPTKRGLERNTYDPAYWWREKMLGSLERRPPECLICGWLHEDIEPHGEMCWCGSVHPVALKHDRQVKA